MMKRTKNKMIRRVSRILVFTMAVLLGVCACGGAEPVKVNSMGTLQTETEGEGGTAEKASEEFSTLQESERNADSGSQTVNQNGTQEMADRSIHMVLSGKDRSLPERAENMVAPDLQPDNEEVEEIQTNLSAVNGAKEYTIMVYMIGSSLEYDEKVGYIGAATADIEEMLLSGVDYDSVNVIIYTGGTVSWASGLPAYVNCVLDLSEYTGDGDLTGAIVGIHENSPNMGNPYTLSSFINFCAEYYPAKKNGLIFWDHGSGPIYGYGRDALHSNDSLLLPEMKTAMEETPYSEGTRLSFVGFDACLMSSLENAVIWKDFANYMVASEEKEAGMGLDYAFLGDFASAMEDQDLADEIVKTSVKTLSDLRSDYTLSVLDLSQAVSVVDALDELFSEVNQSDEDISMSILKQRTNTMEFGRAEGEEYVNSEMIDLVSFCSRLSHLLPEETKSLRSAIDRMVVTNKSNLQEANGVSLYYPYREMKLYRNVFENYYKIVNPSVNYDVFLNKSAEKWENGSFAFEDGETNMTEGPEPPDGNIVFPLTQIQMETFGTAAYTIYEVQENEDGEDDFYLPVLANVQISPDEYGRLLVPADPLLICSRDEIGGNTYPYSVWQIAHESSRDVYQVLGAFLTADRLNYDFLNSTSLGVSFRIVQGKDGSFQVQDIVSLTDDDSGTGRQEPDLSRYEALAILPESYFPETTENGYYLPIANWRESSAYWGTAVSFEGNFPVTAVNSSEFDTDYVAQITYTDVYGNVGTSGFVPLEKKQIFTGVETTGGMLRFRIENDHAELISYEGGDYEIEIPDAVDGKPVTIVGNSVFNECESVRKITIPDGVISIADEAFRNCANLKQISLPNTLMEIASYAFINCNSLEDIELPDSLEILSDSAFSGCSALRTIRLPASLKKLGSGVFGGCTSLEKIEVDVDCHACKLVDQMLLSEDGRELLAVPQGLGTYLRIPDGVETIAYAAVAGFSDLKRVEFPESLKVIRNYAFWECSSLDDLKFPGSLQSIGAYAFGGIYDNNYDGIPDREIGKPLHIGKNVDYIGPYAFEGTCTEEIVVDEENRTYSSRDGFLMDKSGVIAFEIPTGQIKYGEFIVPEGVVGFRDNLFGGNYSLMISDYYLPASLSYMPVDSLPYHQDDIRIIAPAESTAEIYAETLGVRFRAEE